MRNAFLKNLWAMHGPELDGLLTHIAALGAMAIAEWEPSPAPTYERDGCGVAHLALAGPLFAAPDPFCEMLGGTVTADFREALSGAVDEDQVQAIMLHIDSPGGQTDGMYDLAAGIAMADAVKPVVGFIHNLGASAAYWAGSQCRRLACDPMAMVGSIGVAMVIEDAAQMFQNAGVKVHVISSGGMKGAGTFGAPVTAGQIEYFTGLAQDLSEIMVSGIAQGRHLSAAQAVGLADGCVHVGTKAMNLGLVDAVFRYDDFYQETLNMLKLQSPQQRFNRPYASAPLPRRIASAAPPAAQQYDPVARFEGRVRELVSQGVDRMKAVAQIDQENPQLRQDYIAAKTQHRQAGTAAASVQPGTTGGGAVEKFDSAVRRTMAERGLDRSAAMAQVIGADPDLHRAYLNEWNEREHARQAAARQRSALGTAGT